MVTSEHPGVSLDMVTSEHRGVSVDMTWLPLNILVSVWTWLPLNIVVSVWTWLPLNILVSAVTSEHLGVSSEKFKLQNPFLSGLNRKWLNSGLNIPILTVFLAVDRA